ncbi:hypothetical protein LMH87_001452 [Akanthomyces muscarius]|uniref:Mannose-1-phosphate guanylyltransferase n=1 Tax=Akanthomyces muscarius TaxID=2231603 RepID=A0A9W8Q4V0_AKAMU|nr:hypothetical protein LMH87_001452 [Akanthomyces muscarius]KAJ4146893.1 hypothetical protein LMH87_001452 [Akanthomyces muscarius]
MATSGAMGHYHQQLPPMLPSHAQYSNPVPYQYGYASGLTSPPFAPPSSFNGMAARQNVLPLPGGGVPGQNSVQQSYAHFDNTGQQPPPRMKPHVTTTLWEDEGSLCFQVEARGIWVARREDNHMINGTKLLNVAGMTRGRRDGILKSEKTRHVIKSGPKDLKGIWIPYDRALEFANKEKISELLYPLFLAQNAGSLLYHPTNQSRTNQGMAASDRRKQDQGQQMRSNSSSHSLPSMYHQEQPAMAQVPGPQTTLPSHSSLARPGLHTFPTPTSASTVINGMGASESFSRQGHGMNGQQATTSPGSTLQSLQSYPSSGHGGYDNQRQMYNAPSPQQSPYQSASNPSQDRLYGQAAKPNGVMPSDQSVDRQPGEASTVVSHQHSNGNHHQSEAHMSTAQAPALQDQAPLRPVPTHGSTERLVQSQPAEQVDHASATSRNDSRAVVQDRASTDPEQGSGTVVPPDPRKRKRLFSRRTKTGCLTCRARKKKCDEAKPICNTCIKADYKCTGYSPQRGAGMLKLIRNEAGGYSLDFKDRSSLPCAFGDCGINDYQRHRDGRTSPASSAQRAAQTALSHAQAQPRSMAVAMPCDQRHPTQKEEMLQGGYFYQYDRELSLERDRAATACWRFNTLAYPPTNGVSTEERARLFLDILQPRKSSFSLEKEAANRNSVARVGYHVAVESPFYCDYGYNICIGNNVSIGKGCTLSDAGQIQIGDNCIIGPNVSMYTIELSTDPKHRQGCHGTQLSKGIVIKSDCWIGGGAIILPGKVVGRGSTIGAGSVVTKDVLPFTVVAGNPARVLRGVTS